VREEGRFVPLAQWKGEGGGDVVSLAQRRVREEGRFVPLAQLKGEGGGRGLARRSYTGWSVQSLKTNKDSTKLFWKSSGTLVRSGPHSVISASCDTFSSSSTSVVR
jgi:hypothetical protein